jgi:S1-C subfamily serine protease
VEPNSPADVAGMKVGDLLTAIDGRPAGELDLQKNDEVLQQGGQTISLTVLRNGRRLKISLTLRERI